IAKRVAEYIDVHDAVACHGGNALDAAFVRDLMSGGEHGLVFDRRSDDGFAPAGCEADLVCRGAKAVGHALAGLVERRPSVAAPAVHAGRVPEARPEERHHRLEDLGSHRRRGGVIQVDGGAGHSVKYKVYARLCPKNLLLTSQSVGKNFWSMVRMR